MTILYILLFILCLSTLIMVHEAGHLLTAKIFKVYCFEYAIGFGPKLISYKRKNGETRFSIRAIPFGGFVSMYGESDALPEDFEGTIDESRSLNHIAKWKRAIIMTAGIMMNFLLAIVIFFVYELAFPAYEAHYGHVTIKKDSIAYNAGLKSNAFVYTPILSYNGSNYVFYDDEASVSFSDNTSTKAYFGFNYNSMTLKDQFVYNKAVAFKSINIGNLTSYTPISYDDVINGDYTGEEVIINGLSGYLRAFAATSIKEGDSKINVIRFAITENYDDKADKAVYGTIKFNAEQKDEFNNFKNFVPTNAYITIAGDIAYSEKYKRNEFTINDLDYQTTYPDLSSRNILKDKTGGLLAKNISFKVNVITESNNSGRGIAHEFNGLEIDNGVLPKNLGISMQLLSYRNNFGEAIKYTFEDFGNAATLIYRGLGSLFTKDGIKNVGGILAIGVYSTQILEQNGFGQFLFYWALISVNLGIVNLLPFPGLDGWHFLVAIVEGVTKKEINPKFKSIASAIGLILLFSLMILILLKDIISII